MRVLVTGASGKAGRWVVRDLVAAGHDVLATDVAAALPDCPTPFIRADLTEFGEAIAITATCSWPRPTATCGAWRGRRARRPLGLDFEDEPPRYAPLDEDHYPVPTTTYALSKVVAEAMATQVAR